jgi:hypothetical protein
LGVREAALELGDALRGHVGLLAQRGRLTRLGEVEQNEYGQPDNRGEASIGAHRRDEMVD